MSALTMPTTRRDEGRRQRVLAPPQGGRFAAVIFDMGSTLLEFENVPWAALYPSSVESAYRMLQRLGKPLPPTERFTVRFNELLERRRRGIREEQREYRIGDLLRDLVRPFDIHLLPDEMERLHAAYYAPIRRQVTVYPDAEATLAELKSRGYRLGLLSNTCFRARDHREELQHFGIWPHLDAAVFTSTGVFRKPHPEPFRLVAHRLRVSARRCLYVGDRQHEDAIGATHAGMTAVLVRRPRRAYEPGATRCVEIAELRELPARLAG
ncbi:MAG: HAD family hydrolase [Candidatus Zixiibacteriota bacterium]